MKNRICWLSEKCGFGIAITWSVFVLLVGLPMTVRAVFTPGNLAVFLADSAGTNNATFTILELDPSTANQSSPVNAIPINGTNGPNALRTSGSATSTGYLADSNDGTLVAFSGHNSTSASVNANTITTRGVGTLNSDGTFSLVTTYTGASGNQTRSATSVNNSTWFIGDQGGFYSNGSTSASPSANIRSVKSFAGTVYAFIASTSLAPVGTISAATGGSYAGLPGLATGASSRQDFYLVSSAGNNTYDVLYILDATSATAGTLFKYSLVSGSWTANGSYVTSFGGFGLCASRSGAAALLYVTTGTGATVANKVIRLTDTAGYNSGISITTGNNLTLYTAAAGPVMKGIAFAPIAAATAPVVESSAATDLGTTTATLNGNVSSDGGATITDRSFVYKTSAGVTSGDNKTTVSGTTGSYSLNLSALDVNAQYYFKAYALNSAGATLSSPELSLWTLANTPTAPIVHVPATNGLNLAIGAGDGNPSNTIHAIQVTNSGNYLQLDGSLDAAVVYQTASAWGIKTVIGLDAATMYGFQVKTVNGAGVETDFGPITTAVTAPAPVGGTANPAFAIVCSGSGTSVGLSGQTGDIVTWQSSTDNWTTTNDIASTDNPLSTGPLTMATTFRAVVQGGEFTATSSPATVTVAPASVGGTASPALSVVCSGSATTIGLSGHAGDVVKWQSSTDSWTTTNDIASTDNPLNTGPLTAATAFRAVVQGGACATTTSSVATVAIEPAPAITTDATNQTVYAGVEVTWSVVASGNGLSYQWQRDGTNLVEETGNFAGTTNSILTNSAVGFEDSLPEAQGYVCIVSGTCAPTVSSSRVSLTVEPAPVGGMASPALSVVCSGTGTTIGLSGHTGEVVKWQSSTDGWTTTNDIASTDNPLSTGQLTATTQFRAVVQSGGYVAISSVATMMVDRGSVGGMASPPLGVVCGGSATTIALSGQTGAIVKWQSSTDNWITTNDEVSTSNSLSTGPLTNATVFRAVLQSGVCAAVYSSEATVSVDWLSAAATFSAIACNGGTSSVTVTATGGTEPYTGTGQFNAVAGHHSYTVSDANGCSATAHVDIPEQTTPPLVVSAGPNQEIYAGTSALIGGSPTAPGDAPSYTCQWSPTNGLNNPTLQNCIAAPSVTTAYTVTVTDSNGCVASASVTVVVSPAPPHEPLGPSSRKTPIAFSEIMYEPASRVDGNNMEFIEVYNSNPWFEDIGGYRIVGDSMNFTFPAGTILPANAFVAIAASPSSLQTVYGITNVLGPYTGNLKKSGTLQLLDEQGAVLLTVEYSNGYPWPVGANGTGHSIILANPTYGEGDPRAWSISDTVGGSPGKLDTLHPSPMRDVVINEVLAHSENPGVSQFVELYNHSTQTNDLSGCILSVDAATNKFIIPAETSVGPGGFVSFTEAQLGFRLSGGGGTIYFIQPDGSRILDAMQYEAQADGISVGRWPDGACAFYSLTSRTAGTNNSDILIGDIVINELMYHPISDDDDAQYIELFNQGTNSVNLGNWKFVAGVTYTFPADTTLAPNSYLVIARKLTTLLARYPNLNSGNTLGNYGGKLSHNGERVALAMPQTLASSNSDGTVITNIIYVLEDEVTYGTGGRWGQWADGRGTSLELIDPWSNHRLPANWADSDETQKSDWVTIETKGVLDHGAPYFLEPPFGHAQIGLLDVGECLVENIEVLAGTNGPNLVVNPGFETGLANWSLMGDHIRSSLEGPGYASNYALHIRASDQMWTGVNSCELALSTNSLAEGQTATLRFKARWLRGWPEVLLRLNGNYLEATGPLLVPLNLGTPGTRNSQVVTNAGPAIYEVHHAPAIPAAGETVVVSAQAQDPNGVQSMVLNYRPDPATSYSALPMKDDGTAGDAISGDGVFSAMIPGQSSNSIVAFYIAATDSQGATTRFPSLLNDNSPVRECLVMFGDPNPIGTFGVYHFWVTKTNVSRWGQLLFLSNEPHDCTFVSGTRVIYNTCGQYQGSPAKQPYIKSPVGALCNYKWTFPDDDHFLGATSLNPLHHPGNTPGDDPSLQREQAANTFLRALGVPWIYRRFVAVYVNGNRRGMLMEDAQRPNKDVVKEHFPNDPDGWLYKMQAWFEFATQPDTGDPYYIDYISSSCNLMPYTTTGGVKKTERYRWNFLVRRTPDSANNFTNVFALVDAANSYGTPGYAARMEALADMENWMRTFAANHAGGNWDSFGAENGQNVYSYFGTAGTKCTLFNYDFNLVFPNFHWGPGEHLFTVNPEDQNTANIYREPTFRRMYWRALKELVNGPLDVGNSGRWLDAKYKVFVANGFSVEDPGAWIKPWITAARNSIAAQIAAEDTTNFTANLSVAVSNDLASVSGTAPVNVKTILFDGIEYPITWTTVTNWTVQVPLQPGTNQFSVVGIDMHGQNIPGATDNISAASSNAVISLPPLSFIPYNEPGLAYLQNFDTLPNPGAQSVNSANPVTINGITYSLTNPFGFASPVISSGNVGGLASASLAGWYGMGSVGSKFGATYGDQTTGGILSFGLPNSSNRALGLLATSSTGPTAFGAKFVNRTGRALTRMTLQITGEVWRQSDVPKSLQFYYWIDPTAGAGFSTNYTALDSRLSVSFPTVPADVGGVAVDGASSVNQTALGLVNQAISWPPDAALWLRWQMAEPTARAQGLGIDNLSFSASDQPMANPVFLDISSEGTTLSFSWPTLAGQQYQLEYNDDLGTTNWIPFGAPIDGTGRVAIFTENITNSNRFFRLRFLLP